MWFATNVGLVIWMLQVHLGKSWTLAPRERSKARTLHSKRTPGRRIGLVPNFAFGFLENGEGGSRRTWFFKKSGRRRGAAADQQGHSGKDSEED